MKRLSSICYYIVMTFLVLPVITMIIWSFFATWSSDELLPEHITLNGFRYFFKSGDYVIAFKSACFSLFVGIFAVVLSILLSRFLIRCNSRYKSQLESLFYFPMLLPVVSISIGSHKMFLGLQGDLAGITIVLLHVYFSLPYAFKIIYSCYSVWGMEYEQIGRELGASEIKAFFLINLPIYLRGYISGFIMAFVVSYSQYFINYFMGDPRFVNFSMIMTPYITGSNRNISSTYTLMYVVVGIAVMMVSALIEKKYGIKEV